MWGLEGIVMFPVKPQCMQCYNIDAGLDKDYFNPLRVSTVVPLGPAACIPGTRGHTQLTRRWYTGDRGHETVPHVQRDVCG
jgi:hypothetical protein